MIAISLLWTGISLGQAVSLQEIYLQSNPDDSPAIVDADSKGGVMRFTRNYSSSCKTNYVLKWTFSRDVQTLDDGEEFEVTLDCISCQSSCGKKWTSGSVSGSNNIFWPIGETSYESEYNGNISGSTSSGRVNGWDPNASTATTKLVYRKKKSVPFTAFYIIMGDHRVYYIYGNDTAPDGPVNCHTLLGLGKNLFSLEYGALDDKDIGTWMIPTIDNALSHVTASGCLSPAYLTDLRKRMLDAESSLPFYNEIQQYAADVEEEIITSCSCCVSCGE